MQVRNVHERRYNVAPHQVGVLMNARGRAAFTWPLLFRPLHDALVEDCLDTPRRRLGSNDSAPGRGGS